VRIIGAGRTDAGVHALGQVAHLCTSRPLAVQPLMRGLNVTLPRDVRVVEVGEAAPRFHSRFSAIAKEYRYHYHVGELVPPFLRRYCHGVRSPLDVAAMARAAHLFEGTQDLSSFRASACSSPTPMRTVHRSVVAARGAMVVFAICGRSFLQRMVRIIAGTLLEVGRGKLGIDDVRAVLAAKDRVRAPATAPARGLFLVRVVYEDREGALEATPDPVLTCL